MLKLLFIFRDMYCLLSVNIDDNFGVCFVNFFLWFVIEIVVWLLMV